MPLPHIKFELIARSKSCYWLKYSGRIHNREAFSLSLVQIAFWRRKPFYALITGTLFELHHWVNKNPTKHTTGIRCIPFEFLNILKLARKIYLLAAGSAECLRRFSFIALWLKINFLWTRKKGYNKLRRREINVK